VKRHPTPRLRIRRPTLGRIVVALLGLLTVGALSAAVAIIRGDH